MLFEASRARTKRAQAFIDELRELYEAYARDDPLTVRLKTSPAGVDLVFDWKGTGLLPGVVVGDCIHSLRTSLDLMSSEMARLNGHSDKNVHFPFADTLAEFEKAIKNKNFKKCGDDAVSLLNTLKPYRGGNEHLRALHDLDIQDKHQALIPTHSTMDFDFDKELVIDGPAVSAGLAVSDVVLTFPPNGPLDGLPLAETLENLVHLVEGILDSFETLVLGRPAKGVTP